MSTQKNESAFNEENNKQAQQEKVTATIITTDPVSDSITLNPKPECIEENLQDDGAPDDYTDHQESQQKPDGVKSEQEKENEAMEEPHAIDPLDIMKKNAFKAFVNGQMSLYMAIAWACIWLYFVTRDEDLRDEIFKNEIGQGKDSVLTKTIKICFKIDVKQKSTISMYKDCLAYLNTHLPDTISAQIRNDEACAQKIANFIKGKGGIKKCASLSKAPKTPIAGKGSLSKNDYKRAQQKYSSSRKVTGTFNHDVFKAYQDTDLVIMVARRVKGTADTVEVIDVLKDEDLLNQIIKFKTYEAQKDKKSSAESEVMQNGEADAVIKEPNR